MACQSGAPVLSADAHDVVGFIEGQWLRPAAGLAAQMEQGATSIGAAVPIRYAIAVLKEKGISWRADTEKSAALAAHDQEATPWGTVASSAGQALELPDGIVLHPSHPSAGRAVSPSRHVRVKREFGTHLRCSAAG